MRSWLLSTVLIASLAWPAAPSTAADTEIFDGFTNHIAQQIASDKRTFVQAQTCTQWFYRERDKKPRRAPVQGVSYRRANDSSTAPCAEQYPGGLEAARDAFGRTQSTLSISLTFYELALVGDRNDDQRYSANELQDLLESCGLPFTPTAGSEMHLVTLTRHFDELHRSGGLEALMTGMGALYEKGYRLTSSDRGAMDRIAR